MKEKIQKLLTMTTFSDPAIMKNDYSKPDNSHIVFTYNRRGWDEKTGEFFPDGPAINGEISIQFIQGGLWQFHYCDFNSGKSLTVVGDYALYNAEAFIDFLLSKALN